MSFSFRNLFSQDESGNSGESDPSREGGAADGRASFLPDGTSSAFQGSRDGGPGGSASGIPPGARFMINELLPFIPPAIAAPSGIPMEQMVEIPLPADGSRDVKLSTIYQLCPNLFASEITPLNDSVVTLPPRIGDSVASGTIPSEAARMGGQKINPFADAAASPVSGFSQPTAGAGPSAESSSDNPFWSPEPEATPGPNSVPEQAPSQSPMGGHSPFGMASPPAQNNSPMPAGPASGPFGQSENETPQAQGFLPPAEKKPEDSASSFSAFQPAVPAEKASEPAENQSNPFGESSSTANPGFADNQPSTSPGEAGFSTLFSEKAKQDASISSPEVSSGRDGMSEGFGAGVSDVPAQTGGGFGASSVESPSHGLSEFGVPPALPVPKDEEDEDDGEFEGYLPPEIDEESLSKIPGLMETEESKDENVLPVSDEPVHFDDLISSGDEEQSGPPPMSFFDELSASGSAIEQDKSEPFSAKPSPAFNSPQFEAASSVAEPYGNFGQSMPEPAEAESIEPGAIPNLSSSNSMKDLELRAVFGIEGSFSHQKVADLIAEMAGIEFCSLSAPNGSASAGQDDAAITQEGVREMAKNVRQLAEFSGIKDASTFTLQTNQGMVSIFLEGNSCLTVRHSNSIFGPGVRERLILVARSLDRLEG